MSDRLAKTRAEVVAWFFQDYLARWVAAGSGASGEGPEFILNYWDTPMHVTALESSHWFLDKTGVLQFLDMNHAPLREAGYSHTTVLDKRVYVYNSVGAAIEVIWSRRRADAPTKARFSAGPSISRSPSPTRAGAWSPYNLSPPSTKRSPQSGRAEDRTDGRKNLSRARNA